MDKEIYLSQGVDVPEEATLLRDLNRRSALQSGVIMPRREYFKYPCQVSGDIKCNDPVPLLQRRVVNQNQAD